MLQLCLNFAMDYVEEFQGEYHHFEYLLKEIRNTDIWLHKNTEDIMRHIIGGMNKTKTNFFTVFGKKKSPCCRGQSISRPNTYYIYIIFIKYLTVCYYNFS